MSVIYFFALCSFFHGVNRSKQNRKPCENIFQQCFLGTSIAETFRSNFVRHFHKAKKGGSSGSWVPNATIDLGELVVSVSLALPCWAVIGPEVSRLPVRRSALWAALSHSRSRGACWPRRGQGS